MLFLLCGVAGDMQASKRPVVMVTIAPYKFFVKKIAGDTVDVEVLVPPGASLHSYEPRLKQMLRLGETALWFRTGDPGEAKTLSALQGSNPSIRICDLREGIPLIEDGCGRADCFDPHIWLSPKLALTQAETIASCLIDLLPQNEVSYVHNLQKLVTELHHLDGEISQILSSSKQKAILVSHPAYSYFCRDYGLEQISLESEGKEASPKKLTEIIERARAKRIDTVFVQVQHNTKGAELVAKELNAKVVVLDPNGENYPEMMRQLATSFAGQ